MKLIVLTTFQEYLKLRFLYQFVEFLESKIIESQNNK